VDPVPFCVPTGLAFGALYALGPAYFVALGASFEVALLLTTVAFSVVALLAYYRFVWTLHPDHGAVPARVRFERLLYGALALAVISVGLVLPLLRW
jgi:hypothetical protein